MTLPKKGSRTLEYNGQNYRWMVGKSRQETSKDGVVCNIADLVVETPEGKTFKEALFLSVGDGPVEPVTARDAINLIEVHS